MRKFSAISARRALSVLLLSSILFSSLACGISEVTLIANSAISAMELYAALSGSPVDVNWETQITTDAQLFTTAYNQYESSPAAGQVALWPKVQQALTQLQSDIVPTLQAFHVANPASQAKLTAVVSFVVNELNAWVMSVKLSKNPEAAMQARASISKPVLMSESDYVTQYNKLMTVTTGDKAADARAGQLKVHNHNAGVRVLTLGMIK